MTETASYLSKVKKFSYPFFAATFGLTPFISSLALALFLLGHALFPKDWRSKNLRLALVFGIPYLIYLFSSTYSYNSYEAMKYLIRTLPMVILPFLIAINKGQFSNLKEFVILFYIYGLFVSCVLSLTIGAYFYSNTGDVQAFLYYDIAEYLSLHPTYYSLYLIVGIVLLLFSTIRIRGLKIIAFILFTLTIVLLQTRIAYVVLGLLLIVKIFNSPLKQRLYLLGVLGSLMIIILLIIPSSFKQSKQIFPETSDYSILIGTDDENGITQRIWLWKTAWEQIQERVIFGYGLKSQQDIFKWKVHKEILKNNSDVPYKKAALEVAQLNLHNQYMQILYESGIVGLILFVFASVLIIYHGFRQKNTLFLLIYSSFLIFLFTENLLDRQMGLYFYSFLIPFFFYYSKDAEAKIGE